MCIYICVYCVYVRSKKQHTFYMLQLDLVRSMIAGSKDHSAELHTGPTTRHFVYLPAFVGTRLLTKKGCLAEWGHMGVLFHGHSQ